LKPCEVEGLTTKEYWSALAQAFNMRRYYREPQFDKQGNVINDFEIETRQDKTKRLKRRLRKLDG